MTVIGIILLIKYLKLLRNTIKDRFIEGYSVLSCLWLIQCRAGMLRHLMFYLFFFDNKFFFFTFYEKSIHSMTWKIL